MDELGTLSGMKETHTSGGNTLYSLESAFSSSKKVNARQFSSGFVGKKMSGFAAVSSPINDFAVEPDKIQQFSSSNIERIQIEKGSDRVIAGIPHSQCFMDVVDLAAPNLASHMKKKDSAIDQKEENVDYLVNNARESNNE